MGVPNIKAKILMIFILSLIVLLSFQSIGYLVAGEPDIDDQELYCSNFTVVYGDTVYFCNNEDWRDMRAYYWVAPATDETFGGFFMGFNFARFSGLNEKGLCFDSNSVPGRVLNHHPELPMPPEILGNLFMSTCSTVQECIDILQSYNWGAKLAEVRVQIHVADATGDAAVIGVGADGEWSFTRKPANEEGYLLATNFNLADGTEDYNCWRYDTAKEMLDENITGEETATIENLTAILDAVHQKFGVHTIYSNIFDLKNGIIYLYHFHQYGEVVTLNLEEELAREEPFSMRIADLFSEETVQQAQIEYLVSKGYILIDPDLPVSENDAIIQNLSNEGKVILDESQSEDLDLIKEGAKVVSQGQWITLLTLAIVFGVIVAGRVSYLIYQRYMK